jgi:hypothetical protein
MKYSKTYHCCFTYVWRWPVERSKHVALTSAPINECWYYSHLLLWKTELVIITDDLLQSFQTISPLTSLQLSHASTICDLEQVFNNLGWGYTSAQNASVVTNVVTSILEINKRGECYAFFWLHCRQNTNQWILQLCGASTTSVITHVVMSAVGMNKRGVCYAFFWLHCWQKTTHRILQVWCPQQRPSYSTFVTTDAFCALV